MYTTHNLSYKLLLGIVVNLLFTIVEFGIGILSGSLSLISDASHNFTDVLSLCVTLFAYKIAQKRPSFSKTYGYGKVTLLGALINGLILFTLACSLFYEAYQRFYQPQVVEGGTVIILGFLGILVNGGIALLFLKERKNLIIHSAFLNMLFDALASAGAFFAGLIILLTGYTMIDTLMSIGIGILLVLSSYRVLKEAIHLLLEGIPSYVDPHKIMCAIKDTPCVIGFDDFHLWALSSDETALSCHVILNTTDLPTSVAIVQNIKQKLKKECKISHATIEIELQLCSLCPKELNS